MQVYYVFATNEEWDDHDIRLDLSAFNPDPWANVVVTAVGENPSYASGYHGEVAFMQPLDPSLSLSFSLPKTTIYSLAVPKVPVQSTVMEPDADATLSWGGGSTGLSQELVVTTTNNPSVAVLRFSTQGKVGNIGIVTAVLQLTLIRATNTESQILTVLGFDQSWDEVSISWESLDVLSQVSVPVDSTAKNFVNWNTKPTIVGHMTVPPGDSLPSLAPLRLDVTEFVQRGITNFLVLRPFRMDASGTGAARLPADNIQGSYVFGSREHSDFQAKPKLLVGYQIDRTLPPPPPPPPPPASSV